MTLTGLWELDLSLSSSQSDLLRAMRRPEWQISVIDKAKEKFRLLHYFKPDTQRHYLHKSVHIHLDSKLLDVVSRLFNIPFNQVTYSHWLICNGAAVEHKDDEKRFGPCKSVTTYEDNCIIIRWYLENGLLHVRHWVDDQDRLNVQLTHTNGDGHVVNATKIYRRIPFREPDERFIGEQKVHRPFLRLP